MDYYSRWKVCCPTLTTARIEVWLEKIGLEVQRSAVLRTGTCVASTLTLGGGYLFVNGKGGSEDFCWASAYGELVERLATRALHRYRFVDTSNESAFSLLPDCILVSRDVFSSERILRRFGGDIFEYDTALGVQETFFRRDQAGVHCEPFMSLLEHEERLVPVSVADVVIGTNGMAFGNDEAEADQQALAELCERFANRIVVTDRIALPEFPRNALQPELLRAIQELEQRLGIVVRVLDASLGRGLPVISTLVEDVVSGRYFVKFGAHLNPSVAAERCLTELFQGRTGDNLGFLRERAYVEDTYWQARNLDSILHNGDGFYPPEYFVPMDEDLRSTWPTSLETNQQATEYMQNILLKIGGDILRRVYATQPGYVVRYIVPGVSELTMNAREKLNWRLDLAHIRELLPKFGSLHADDMDAILEFVQQNCDHDMVSLLPMLPHALPASSRYRVLTLQVITFLRAMLTESNVKLHGLAERYTAHPAHDVSVARAMFLAARMSDDIDLRNRRVVLEYLCDEVLRLGQLRDEDFCAGGECRCNDLRAELDLLRVGAGSPVRFSRA